MISDFDNIITTQGSVQCLQFDDYKIVSGSWDTSVMVRLVLDTVDHHHYFVSTLHGRIDFALVPLHH